LKQDENGKEAQQTPIHPEGDHGVVEASREVGQNPEDNQADENPRRCVLPDTPSGAIDAARSKGADCCLMALRTETHVYGLHMVVGVFQSINGETPVVQVPIPRPGDWSTSGPPNGQVGNGTAMRTTGTEYEPTSGML
jgi:hypothetical protein